jgi:hypothetical protein
VARGRRSRFRDLRARGTMVSFQNWSFAGSLELPGDFRRPIPARDLRGMERSRRSIPPRRTTKMLDLQDIYRERRSSNPHVRRDKPAFTLDRGMRLACRTYDGEATSRSPRRTCKHSASAGFRSGVTVFRLNAVSRRKSGSESAFRRNTAGRVHTNEAAHNPEVAGFKSCPRYWKRPRKRGLS